MKKGDLKWFIFWGLCEPCLNLAFEAKGLNPDHRLPGRHISAFYPLLTALAAAISLKERLRGPAYLGFGLVLGGIVGLSLVTSPSGQAAPAPLTGNILQFISILWGALFVVSARRLSQHYPPLFLAWGTTLVGLVFFLVPSLFSPFWRQPVFHLEGLLAIMYLGLAVTIVGMTSLNSALSRLSTSRVASTMNLMPVLAIIWGILLLDKTMTWLQAGLAVPTITGIIVSRKSLT